MDADGEKQGEVVEDADVDGVGETDEDVMEYAVEDKAGAAVENAEGDAVNDADENADEAADGDVDVDGDVGVTMIQMRVVMRIWTKDVTATRKTRLICVDFRQMTPSL